MPAALRMGSGSAPKERSEVNVELEGVRRQVHGDTEWPAWAQRHQLTYQEDAPELVGVWFPVFDGHERYVRVVGGHWRGFGFWAFSHGTWNRPLFKDTGHSWIFTDYLFLQLPGALPPEILAMSPDEAFGLLGGRMTSAFDFSYRGSDWLQGIRPHMSVELLEGALENLTVQLSAAPASLWIR